MKRIGVIFILFLSFCGLADSMYLAQNETAGTPLLCNIQGLSGCNIVAQSSYSHLFGIPLADYGILFFSILFVLAALELVLFDQLLRRVIQIAALGGFLASIVFMIIQVFLIGALCVYCTASAAITLIVLVTAWFIEPRRKRALPAASEHHLPMPPAV